MCKACCWMPSGGAGGNMPRNPLLDAAFDAMRIRSS